MASATDFAKFVPGFDFLQGLLRSAGHVLPEMGKWVAPTLDPEELGQRIEQLKTVQVWLEQNARMLGATVQALEVQRMTLATLKSMNVPVADLGQALQARASKPASPPVSPTASPPADPPRTADAADAATAADRADSADAAHAGDAAATDPPHAKPTSGAAPMVDPMQWWGALTQQFTQLATQAMKEGPVEAARSAASQFADAASRAAQSAPAAAAQAARAAKAAKAAKTAKATRSAKAVKAPAPATPATSAAPKASARSAPRQPSQTRQPAPARRSRQT